MRYHDRESIWRPLFTQALEEDGILWDWTTRSLKSTKKIKAVILAKSNGVWAAENLCRLIESQFPVKWTSKLTDGTDYSKGKVVVEIQGLAEIILGLERSFLNLAQHSCGIANLTRLYVEKVQRALPGGGAPKITLTRKTLPYYRDLAIESVIIGGGYPHRLNLASGILIKENHIAVAGGIKKAIEAVRRDSPHVYRMEVEVRNLKELDQAIASDAEVVMLDNFTPDQARAAVGHLERKKIANPSFKRPVIEISGGVTLENVHDYAIRGVDLISIGSLTHSVKAADLSLLVK